MEVQNVADVIGVFIFSGHAYEACVLSDTPVMP